MTKRVFIIHGWDGYSEEGIFPWLKQELESRDFEVYNPAMPNPKKPVIEEWVSFLAQKVKKPDKNTFLFGHSIGCQTILRYLQSLPENSKIGGVVLLAPWVHLTDIAFEDEEDKITAKLWFETPLKWEAIKTHAAGFGAIFSDNDPLVPLDDSDIFKNNLEAKIIVEHNKGHFSGSDGITKLPSALNSVLELARK